MRTLTERIAKRIRRGQPWGKSEIPDGLILEWALHSAILRSFQSYCQTTPYGDFMSKMWTEYAVNR